MFATIRQTRADERNLFQVESEESGILYRAETPWSGLNLPFDAENLRKLVFTDDGGKEMFHTEYDIVRNTVNSLLKYRYLAGKSVRLSEYRVTGSDGAELGAFYTRIDGALTSQMVISFGGRLYDCYHYALGRIYVISIFDRGRQIAQITKPLDTWNQLDVYYLHLIDSCRDMLPVLSFFTVWVDAARFDGAGRFARYSYQKSRVRTFNRNNDKYDPDWIAKTFGNEAAEQLDFLLETHPEKDSPRGPDSGESGPEAENDHRCGHFRSPSHSGGSAVFLPASAGSPSARRIFFADAGNGIYGIGDFGAVRNGRSR